MKKVTAIVISFNTRTLTQRCVASLHLALRGLDHQVLVFDNASSDGTVDALRQKTEQLKIIQSSQNLGFARACNLAAGQAAESQYYLFANPDTDCAPESVSKMIQYMEQDTDCAILGPRLVYPDGRRQHSFANWPGLAAVFLGKRLMACLNPRRWPAKSTIINEPIEVPSLVGAFFLIRCSDWRQEGGMDERFFFFLEETDLCRRLIRQQRKIVFHPKIEVRHHQGAAARQNAAWSRYQYFRSLYQFLTKWDGGMVCFLVYFFNEVKTGLKCLFYFLAVILTMGQLPVVRKRLATSWHLLHGYWSGFPPRVPDETLNYQKRDGGDWLVSNNTAMGTRQFLDHLVATIRQNPKPFKSSNRATLWRIQFEGEDFMVKVMRHQSWLRRMRVGEFGRTVHHNSRRLMTAGIQVPPSRGYGQLQSLPGYQGSFHVPAQIHDMDVLNFFESKLADWFPARERYHARRRLIRQLGRWVRMLHDRQIFHHDLKASNILMGRAPGTGAPAFNFLLVDLEKISFGFFLPRRLAIKNLVQLVKSFPFGREAVLKDRLLFLEAYLLPAENQDRVKKRQLIQCVNKGYLRWKRRRKKSPTP